MAITVNELAEKCNVSRTTVLRALNERGSVKKETREKILAMASEFGYRPNLLARSLNHGRTMSIGVVAINIENMYFVQSLEAINRIADKRGFFTNIVVCDGSPEWEKKLISGLAERQMEGIIINPVGKGKKYEEFLLSLNTPIVCIGNKVSDKFTTVLINEAQAAEDATKLIVSKGYKKIVFVCPPLEFKNTQNVYSHEKRLEGFEKAVKETGVESEIIAVSDYINEAKKSLRNSKKRTAFLCSGDTYALKIMKASDDDGLIAPKDFGIMGFDNISILDYYKPRLTSVSTNLKGVSEAAVLELITQIDSENYLSKDIFLKHEILDRETL